MRLLELVAHATEEHGIELPMPAFYFGAIAFTLFVVLALVTWSYRDVANRHDHKSDKSAH